MMSKKPKPVSERVFRAELRATTKALTDAIVRTNEATTRVLVETIVSTNAELRRDLAGEFDQLGGRIENALGTAGTAHRSVVERVETLEREVDALKKRT